MAQNKRKHGHRHFDALAHRQCLAENPLAGHESPGTSGIFEPDLKFGSGHNML